jgi:addiction module RelB/DinJ family antitoxin
MKKKKPMSSIINVRVDSATKSGAQKILQEIGLDLSSGIKLFLRNVMITKSVPLNLRTETGFTVAQEQAMIKETEWTKKHGKGYATAAEAMAAIEKEWEEEDRKK